MIAGRRLCLYPLQPGGVLGRMFGDDHRKIGGGEKESLIAEQTRDPFERHRTAMTCQIRKCAPFGDAICVPGHGLCRS
jgi:hypothetical protein